MGAAAIVALGKRNENRCTTGAVEVRTTQWADVTLSASYGPNGDVCDVSALLPTACYGGSLVGKPVIGDDKYRFEVIPGPMARPDSLRIRAVDVTTGLQVAATTDLSGETIRLELDGR